MIAVSALVCALGCRDAKLESPAAVLESPAPDPAALFALFSSLDTAPLAERGADLRVEPVGPLTLPAPALAVGDPFFTDAPLLLAEVPAGAHTVQLLIAAADGDERVAAARIAWDTAPPASWTELGAIPVDSGRAAFYEPGLSAAVAAEPGDLYLHTLMEALDDSSGPTSNHALLAFRGHDVLVFSSGFGDGAYPVFLGRTATGAPAAVLVDFQILPWPS